MCQWLIQRVGCFRISLSNFASNTVSYSQKYWRSKCLVVWLQRRCVVISAEFKFGNLTITVHTVAVNKKLTFRRVRRSYQRTKWLVFTPFTGTLSQARFRSTFAVWIERKAARAHAWSIKRSRPYSTIQYSTCENDGFFDVQEAAYPLLCFARSQGSCYNKRTTEREYKVFQSWYP